MKIITAITLALIAGNLFAQTIMFDNEYAIWPNGAPGSTSENWPYENYKEEWNAEKSVVKNVTQPTLRVFFPEKKTSDAALIICPGGGYNVEVIDREGYKIAEKFNSYGITTMVLKYRHYSREAALQDARRAIQFVRSKAEEWELDTSKIGFAGNSAGGHLAANAGTNFDPFKGLEKDKTGQLNGRPDFTLLIYPAYLYGLITPMDTTYPPSFIIVASNDYITPYEDCMHYYRKMIDLNVQAELHIFQQGGHGFDLGANECHCEIWTDLFVNWLKMNGIIKEE